MRLQLALIAALSLGGLHCNSAPKSDKKAQESDSEEDTPKKKKKAKPADSAVAGTGATAKGADGAATASGSAPPPPPTATAVAAPDPPPAAPPPLAPGRSPVPTLAEWGSQLKEVNVKGSSALACETKMVREYLRVSCKDKNDSGGTPTAVKVTKGGREAWTFASGGVASLVIPYVEGIDAEVLFSWTDKSHVLKLRWPKGSPKPAFFGVFEGAASPQGGGGASADGEARLCACHKKLFKTSCDAMFAGYNPFCDADFKNDCEKLLECSRGEPSAMPSCPAGTERGGTGHWCYKRCTSNADCSAGQSCDTSTTGVGKVCFDN